MGITFISPDHRNIDVPYPLTIDAAISILEAQVKGWFLDIGQQLTSNIAADYVVLMIIASYFEQYEMLRSGKDSIGDSTGFFRRGFKDFLDSVNVSTPDESGQMIEHVAPSEAKTDTFIKALYV